MTENALSCADTIGKARAKLREYLTSDSEGDYLLCHILKCQRSYLYAHQEEMLENKQTQDLQHLFQQRLEGVPLAYLTGTREFFSLEFEVNSEILIPRPETELLVEVVLPLIPNQAHVLDLGTGCGAIAIAIASENPDATITACDNNANALVLAKRNAQRHKVNISFIKSDWFSQLPHTYFDVIVSNPPYISIHDTHLDSAVMIHEPHTAIFAENNGLACLNKVITGAPARLKSQGILALEHGYDQSEGVATMMKSAGFSDIHCTRDLAGHPRVTVGVKRKLDLS